MKTLYVTTNLTTNEQSPACEFMSIAILYGIVMGWVNVATDAVEGDK